jgi:hypothetical protein
MAGDGIRNSARLSVITGVCTVAVLTLSIGLHATGVETAISAKVIETVGPVEIGVPGQPPREATPGDFIHEGEQLIVPRDGSATLAMYDKTLREFTGPSNVAISRDRVEAGTVLGNLTTAVTDMLFSSSRPSSQAVMATRAIGDASDKVSLPILTQPAPGENLISMPRQFKWLGIRGVPLYRITVYSESEMMWQATSPEPDVRWPVKDCVFDPGQTYYWVVEALVGNTSLRSEAGDFTLLDKKSAAGLSKALDEAAASVGDPAKALALQARLCLDMRAYSRALEILSASIEEAPTPEAFALRAEVNRALGLKEQAVSDYRRAVDLQRKVPQQ